MQGSIPPLHVFVINEPPHLIFYRSSIKLHVCNSLCLYCTVYIYLFRSFCMYIYNIYIFPFLSLQYVRVYMFIYLAFSIFCTYTVYLSSEAPRAVCGGRQAGMVCEWVRQQQVGVGGQSGPLPAGGRHGDWASQHIGLNSLDRPASLNCHV